MQAKYLRKLIKEPKGQTRLMTAVHQDGRVWFTNAHWAILVRPADIPLAMLGYLPQAGEEKGYSWSKDCGRIPGGPNINGVIPTEGEPVTLTDWVYQAAGKDSDVHALVAYLPDGRPAFFDVAVIQPVLDLFEGGFELFMKDPRSPLAGKVDDGETVFIVMPLAIDLEGDTAIQAAALVKSIYTGVVQ